jgi:hypothetical protein
VAGRTGIALPVRTPRADTVGVVTTSSVITVAFCSAGVGAMVMYFEMNRRAQQREWDREERERYAEAVDAAEILVEASWTAPSLWPTPPRTGL